MNQATTIEALVARWQGDGYYAPNPAPSAEDFSAFATWYHQRFDTALPAAFAQFLTRANGGQYDAYYLFSIADIMAITEGALPVIVIGDSGNVDRFILRPDGSCAMVDLSDYQHVFEAFPDFGAFLARLFDNG